MVNAKELKWNKHSPTTILIKLPNNKKDEIFFKKTKKSFQFIPFHFVAIPNRLLVSHKSKYEYSGVLFKNSLKKPINPIHPPNLTQTVDKQTILIRFLIRSIINRGFPTFKPDIYHVVH